ncbi:hypothetical protein C8F01DRAFT_1370784 [Mycena amicta]|nr:hypothetical protein C8F01DRAFT_1370784 [Mycena amicta]
MPPPPSGRPDASKPARGGMASRGGVSTRMQSRPIITQQSSSESPAQNNPGGGPADPRPTQSTPSVESSAPSSSATGSSREDASSNPLPSTPSIPVQQTAVQIPTQSGATVSRTAQTPSSSEPSGTHAEYPAYTEPLVQCIIFLVAVLHVRHHLTFRACALILFAFNLIFGLLPISFLGTEKLPQTLKTVLNRLDLKDNFTQHPICPECYRVYEPTSSETLCNDCSCEIFRPNTHGVLNRLLGTGDNSSSKRLPVQVAPIQLLSDAVKDLFARPGMEAAVESWRNWPTVEGDLLSMQDGEIWKTIAGPDGQPFFGPKEEWEIRLGVTLSIDWFSNKTSPYGPSHSAGALSYTIQNLDLASRYNTDNLILSQMSPGPKEPTAPQLQNLLVKNVDDLDILWKDGIRVATPEHPDGILIRVALVAIIADHPAMCKLCGFADHAHGEAPCTKCYVTHDHLFTEKSLKNEFEARDGNEHRKKSQEYREKSTEEEKAQFFKQNGVQWTEFTRLKYFDIVRMTIIDPMHNLLLGLAKTQWYKQWILNSTLRKDTDAGTKRELHTVHDFLATFQSPPWGGKIPQRVGEPAGGSLTADEYKFSVTAPWPIIIPIVWDQFLGDAKKTHAKAMEKYTKQMDSWRSAHAMWKRKRTGEEPPQPEMPKARMQDGEEENFLEFATALKMLCGRSIRIDQVPKIRQHLENYLMGFRKYYGEDNMKPNHHWAVHIADQILDYGPVYGFWAFLTERLNKVLKNLNINNWTGGMLEVSMMRQFHRIAKLDFKIKERMKYSQYTMERSFLAGISSYGESTQVVGTIQDGAATAVSRLQAGTVLDAHERLSDSVRAALVRYYNHDGPQVQLGAVQQDPTIAPLQPFGQDLGYVVLDGRRVIPTTAPRSTGASALVQVQLGQQLYVGEVHKLFIHKQNNIFNSESTILGLIKWLKPSDYSPLDKEDLWSRFPELSIDTWEYEKYVDDSANFPPKIISASQIQCQVCRGLCAHTDPPMWITTTMDRYTSLRTTFDYGELFDADEHED